MNQFLSAIFFLCLSGHAVSGITIVSDLDETIKISNSGSAFGSIKYAFKKGRTYTGMPEFFQGASAYAEKIYVLSASPRLLRRKITKTLRSNGIEFDGIILKRWTRFEDRLKYKVREIRELIEKSDDDFLLFGDDVGDDPEVYARIMELYPNRVLRAYIRLIKNRPVPPVVITHWASHDLALLENAAGRMAPKAVERVISALKEEEEKKYIFPRFATCPSAPETFSWQQTTPFGDAVVELNDELLDYCAM